MTGDFAPMKFEIRTERLYLSMWEESEASWYRELVGERGVNKPTLDAARAKLISFRDKALESGISLLTIRRRHDGDFIGY